MAVRFPRGKGIRKGVGRAAEAAVGDVAAEGAVVDRERPDVVDGAAVCACEVPVETTIVQGQSMRARGDGRVRRCRP